MTIGQVTYELADGIRAMRNLVSLLLEAAAACGVQARSVGTRHDMGVWLEKKDFWVGIEFEEPDLVWFKSWNRRVRKDAAENLPIGTIYEWTSEPGHGWQRSIDLNSEEVHFFSRSKAGQMQFLEKFIRESLELVCSVALPLEPESTVDPADEDE